MSALQFTLGFAAIAGIASAASALPVGGSVEAWGGGTTNTGLFPEFGQSTLPTGLGTCTDVAAGWMHSLALRSGGVVVGFGANTNNLGQFVNQSVVPSTLGVCIGIGAGYYHSAAIKTNGIVAAWGDNRYTQTNVPITIGACTKIDAGGYHTVVLKANGTVGAWGAGTVYGGVLPDLGQCVVPATLGVCAQISGGGYHSAAIRPDGQLFLWGDNARGQASVPAALGVCLQVSCGDLHTVALKTDGTVVCFGAGLTSTNSLQEYGQSVVPAGLGPCTQVSAGGLHTVVVKADGSTAGWGSLSTASGFDPNYGQTIAPAAMGETHSTVLLSGGGRHTLALSKRLYVPSQYATIQTAINASTAGDRVIVAAGIYHESFSLVGKDVVVRGAANFGTILDGTGLTTSIAVFSGNEPATAGLEQLFFRNANSGSLLFPRATILVGGALYGRDSSAFVKGCRFYDCRSDYGGAIYLYLCDLNWQNCTFDGCIGNSEGGGGMVYGCTGRVLNCVFTNNDCGMNGSGSGSGFKGVGAGETGESVILENCTFSGNKAFDSGGAIEFYEHQKYHPGILRLVNTSVTNNTSGDPLLSGAAGLRVIGQQSCCVLSGNTTICENEPSNTSGPFLIEGSASTCDCEGDIFANGQVDAADLGVLLSLWGFADEEGTGDLNHDGMVTATDISLLLVDWGACPN